MADGSARMTSKKTTTGGTDMPFIEVNLTSGRSIDQKREFVEVVTREAARILEMRARRGRYRVRGYREA